MTADCVMLFPTRRVFFENKVVFLTKIMLINDDPLLTGQPPLRSHLLVLEVNEGPPVFS